MCSGIATGVCITCIYICLHDMQRLRYFLNVVSNKTQKLCATASPDLPDLQQAAVPVRTTRRRVATKFDYQGLFL